MIVDIFVICLTSKGKFSMFYYDAEVPGESRQHLLQLEKIQEVLPSRRDEAHFR